MINCCTRNIFLIVVSFKKDILNFDRIKLFFFLCLCFYVFVMNSFFNDFIKLNMFLVVFF